MKKINILLADNHTIIREGVKAMLKEQKNFSILTEAANGQEVLEKIKKNAPDIVVMEIIIPEMNGIETIEIITKKYPDTKVIVLTIHDNETYILKSVEAGASGYLLKDVDKAELIKAIHAVANGDKYFNAIISNVLVTGYLNKVKQTDIKHQSNSVKEHELTKREKGILKMITTGKNNRAIANDLGISIRTIETHRANIMKKLKVKNAVELVRVALDDKIV